MSKKVILQSSDGESFEVDEAVAVHSKKIAQMVEDGRANNEIPLANVKGNILSMVIEYCKKHVEAVDSSTNETKEELKAWDEELMKGMDQSTLSEVILAAKDLNITDLVDLSCQTVADMIKDNSIEEIRIIMNIANDYTPEEEEAIRKENQWAFD